MCRAGGRRCKGSHTSSRATQNTRQQRSRARRALKKAKASGDANAIRKATERLDRANAAHQTAKENAMSHNNNNNNNNNNEPRQHGDVTNIVHGEIRGQQHDVITGGLTMHSSGRITIGNNSGQHRDVANTARTQDRARYQQERAHHQAERERYQAGRAASTSAPTGDGVNVHTGPRDHETGGTGPVTVTDANGRPRLQVGRANGIWVNGKRVG